VVFLCDLGAEQNSAYHRAKIEALVHVHLQQVDGTIECPIYK
jgi:hypothetical protein